MFAADFAGFVFSSGTGIGVGYIHLHAFLAFRMYIIGISAYYHDSAACLLKDGDIVAAAQEERFTRVKNDAGFPENAIRFCLNFAKITLSEVDYITYYEKPFLKFERLLETHLAFAPFGVKSFLKAMPIWLKGKLFFKRMLIRCLRRIDEEWRYDGVNLLFADHHQAHAASAFYPSPFEKAIVLTVDGVGEWATTTVSKADGNHMECISQIDFPHSLGLLYSAFTYYLGFKVNCDEYKVMGLAPYGKQHYADLILENLIDVKPDGSYRLNMRYFNYGFGLTMTGLAFSRLFGQPAREPGSDLSAFHLDIACSIQAVATQIMLKLTTNLHRTYQYDNLCLAGGVALNCVINSEVLKQSGFKNIWIQPAAGDAGGALGAAYAAYHEHLGKERVIAADRDKMQSCLLGPIYGAEEIEEALKFANLKFEKLEDDQLFKMAASEIAAGKVIAYFRGRMEFGPRALGARSIIADPRNAKMQSILNQKIKFRESFRPFAPAVMEEHAGEYFDLGTTSPYMLLVGNVRPEKRIAKGASATVANLTGKLNQIRSVIPAVTHLDYTARLQTVSPQHHPDFYQLIHAFYRLTGCPMVINTSFNRMDEPMVCSPADAIACFINTGIDILVIENYVVRKLNRE